MRNNHIDLLRGSALITIIFIHSLVPYLSNKLVHAAWNWSQFAVQIFVFCSAYLFFSKDFLSTEKTNLSYIVKRMKRLIIPYYTYLLVFIPVLLFAQPHKFSWDYVWKSILMIGGLDIGWLILLFLQLTIVLVFLKHAINNNKLLFYIYFFTAILSSILLLFIRFPYRYQWIMWLPWSVVVVYAYYFKQYEKDNKKQLIILLSSLFIFFLSYLSLNFNNKSLTFFNNKYPPNIYYLSYGIIFIHALYFLSQKFNKYTFINFYSKYSFALYFIHSLVIYLITYFNYHKYMNPLFFFILVLSLSTLIQMTINKVRRI